MRHLATILLCAIAFLPWNRATADDYLASSPEKQFLSAITNAVATQNTAWLAEHMVYPVSVVVSNGTQMVKTPDALAKILDQKLTAEIRAKILKAAGEPLFKNWRGIMAGDGILWFSEVQADEHTPGKFGILAIGKIAFQPEQRATEGP